MTKWIDAHHHLWDLGALHYPWLMAHGVRRFFGDPTPIQRDYLMEEFCGEASAEGFGASVHIQVGAQDGLAEARWIEKIANAHPHWPLVQVAFCDLTAPDLDAQLDALCALPSLRGVRQIVGRAAAEDAQTGTNALLDNPQFLRGLREIGRRGLSFDLQLTPALIQKTCDILAHAPDTKIALCHAASPHEHRAEGLKGWRRGLRSLASLPQVTCKLSGLGMFNHAWTTQSIRPIVEGCLENFGPERIMFGSNFPVDKLTSCYRRLVRSYRELIPEKDRSSVFYETAARFYWQCERERQDK